MKRAISLSSTKEAALYFEQVLPFDVITSIEIKKESQLIYDQCLPYKEMEKAEHIFSEISGIRDKDGTTLSELLALQGGLLFTHIRPPRPGDKEKFEELSRLVSKILNNRFNIKLDFHSATALGKETAMQIRKEINNLSSKLGFGSSPLWSGEASALSKKHESEDEKFGLSISGLSLIDAEALSWDRIIEFRKDKNSIKALRDLRLFFQENFHGKSVEFIIDKLGQLSEEQSRSAKIWGFETAQKTLSVAFSQQSALMGSAGSLAAVLGGASLSMVAGAALIFPAGQCALEFSKIAIESAKDKVSRPTRYLTMLNKLAGSN